MQETDPKDEDDDELRFRHTRCEGSLALRIEMTYQKCEYKICNDKLVVAILLANYEEASNLSVLCRVEAGQDGRENFGYMEGHLEKEMRPFILGCAEKGQEHQLPQPCFILAWPEILSSGFA